MTNLAYKKFGQAFTQLYTSQEQTAKNVIEKHFVGIPERIDYLEHKTLDHVVGQISSEIKPDNNNRIEFYMKIKSRANNVIKNQFLNKLLPILVKNPQPVVENTAQFVLQKLMSLDLDDVTQSGAEKIISTLKIRFTTAQDHGQKFEFLKPMIKFMPLLSETSLETFVHEVINGVIGWPMPFLNRLLDELKQSSVNILAFPNIQKQLIARMNAENPAIGNFLLNFSQNEQKEVSINAISALISKGGEPQLSGALTVVTSNLDN